jgi:hypothetical protein
MYVCNRQPFWITRKKGRFGISFFFRSSSICIDNHFSLIFFCFYFNYMFNLCVWKEHEKQSDADLSIMASSMSCPLLITKEIVLSRLASPTNQTILSINTYTNLVVLSGSIDVLSILIIYLVTNVLYLIWLQRWKHDERERENGEQEGEKLAPMLSSRVPYHHHHHHNNIAWRFHLPPVATNQATFMSRDCWSLSRHLFFHSSFYISYILVCVPCFIYTFWSIKM